MPWRESSVMGRTHALCDQAQRESMVSLCRELGISRKKPDTRSWTAMPGGPHEALGMKCPAIKEVEDGIWLVSFMEYDLVIDLEEKTLQPLETRSGQKLSPMSQERCVTYVSGLGTY